MAMQGIIEYDINKVDRNSKVIEDIDLIPVRSKAAGIFRRKVNVGEKVKKGDLLAEIIEPLDCEIKARITAPNDGIIFFAHDEPLCYANTAVFKIV